MELQLNELRGDIESLEELEFIETQNFKALKVQEPQVFHNSDCFERILSWKRWLREEMGGEGRGSAAKEEEC